MRGFEGRNFVSLQILWQRKKIVIIQRRTFGIY